MAFQPRPLTAGPKRRAAFAKTFSAFPVVLLGFARSTGLGHPDETRDTEVRAARLIERSDFHKRVVRCLAGQFAARILAGRAMIERNVSGPGPLDEYQAQVLQRLEALHQTQLEGFSIFSSDKHVRAREAFERDIAETIFVSLAFEANLKDFDEPRFWKDVFLGLADADRSGCLHRGFVDVFLDDWRGYRAALAAVTVPEPSPAAPAASVAVQ